jgi:predicted adenine nucleotide alpha hydrolase (AANH) superfamily ATPase
MFMPILIHACCADCALKLIKTLNNQGYDSKDITIYFYNPNIHPRSEYCSRLKAIQKISEEEKLKLVVADWSPKEYFGAIKTKSFPNPSFDKARRCIKCWKLRLERSAEYAKEKGFEQFSSTLLSSHYQDSEKIKKIGKHIADNYNLNFFIPEKIDKDLHTKGFYKQIYCGCCYSLKERMEEKFFISDR